MAASVELMTLVEQAATQKKAACSSIVLRAINHKSIYVFAELLEVPSVQDLKGTEEFGRVYNTLELFAYGTFGEYRQSVDTYIDLTSPQLEKLKRLTLISIAMEMKVIPYEHLMDKLEITDLRSLEDLIIETIYSGLLKGKLNQRDSKLTITETGSRDVQKENIDTLIHNLTVLQSSAKYLYDCVQNSSLVISDQREADIIEKEELVTEIGIAKAMIKESIASGEISSFRDRDFSENTFGRGVHSRAPKRIKSGVGGTISGSSRQFVGSNQGV